MPFSLSARTHQTSTSVSEGEEIGGEESESSSAAAAWRRRGWPLASKKSKWRHLKLSAAFAGIWRRKTG